MSVNLSNTSMTSNGNFIPGAMFDTNGDFASLLASLLKEAGKAFDGDIKTARDYVEQASALLAGKASETDSIVVDDWSKSGGRMAPWQALRVQRHIDANIERNITINELAAATRLSRSYFSKVFRRTFGASPHEFVVTRRIDLAKDLMLTTDAPLCQIALDCGMSDQAHLSRLFRKATGESPNGWRRARNPNTSSNLRISDRTASHPSNMGMAL